MVLNINFIIEKEDVTTLLKTQQDAKKTNLLKNRSKKHTCCFSTRKAMVLIPRKQIQQSNGANPEPSAFCRKYKSFANLINVKMWLNKIYPLLLVKFKTDVLY